MSDKTIYHKYMRRCLELAAKGLGTTRANPLVGAVVVYKDTIIAEGFHQFFGGPHAEANAINSVRNKQLLRESVLYINLEPCHHQGKTPPCSLLIKDSGIRNVIIGSQDPNPLVSGNGIRFLRQNGVNIETGVLGEECMHLNRRFFVFQEKKRPYIILKWAESKDGYLDNRLINDNNPPARITGDRSRILSHKWRSEEMAIMVGTNTANMDNPSLTVRFWKGENPLRLTIERHTALNRDLILFNDNNKTIVYNFKESITRGNTEFIHIESSNDSPEAILTDLYNRNIISIIVEGGSGLLESFLKNDLWDEVRVFTGKMILGKGIKAPRSLNINKKYMIGEELVGVLLK